MCLFIVILFCNVCLIIVSLEKQRYKQAFQKRQVFVNKNDLSDFILIIRALINIHAISFLFCYKKTKPKISHFRTNKLLNKRFLYKKLFSLQPSFNPYVFLLIHHNKSQTDSNKITFLSFFFLFLMEYYNTNAFKEQMIFANKKQSYSISTPKTLGLFPLIKHNKTESFRGYRNRCEDQDEQEEKDKMQSTTTQLFFRRAMRNKEEIEQSLELVKWMGKEEREGKVSIEELQDLSFPVLKYRIKDLVEFSTQILRTSQFCNLNYTEKVTKRLVKLLAMNYNSVAYHNFSHAFYFTLLLYQCFSRQHTLRHICTDEQYFYILISGLCHDLNHNGSSNGFEVKSGSQLAKLSENGSVLENMHLRHLWRVLEENQDLNFVEISKNKMNAKKMVTSLILSTDMAFHNKSLEKLREIKKNVAFDIKKNTQHKWTVIQQIFHACDIGNPCGSYDTYISWGALLSHEFCQIARQQKKRGYQVTKIFQMNTIQSVYKDQTWFVGCIVQPLWKQLHDIFPSFAPILLNIDSNLARVKQQLQKLRG